MIHIRVLLRVLPFLCLGILLVPVSLLGLTAEEIIRLKEAGVEDRIIEKLIDQEYQGGVGVQEIERPDGRRERIYFSVSTPEDNQNAQEEREKMERALEVLRGITVEQRRR